MATLKQVLMRRPWWHSPVFWIAIVVLAVLAAGMVTVNYTVWNNPAVPSLPSLQGEANQSVAQPFDAAQSKPVQPAPEISAPATNPVSWPLVQGTWASKELEGVLSIDWIRPFNGDLLLYTNPSIAGNEIWRSQDWGKSWEYLGFGCNACKLEGYTTVKTSSGDLDIIGFRGSLEEELYIGSFITTQALLTNNYSERSYLEGVISGVSQKIWSPQRQGTGWTILARDPANPQLVFAASQVLERTEKIGNVEIPISYVPRFHLSKDAQETWEEINAEGCEPYNSVLPFTSIMVLGQGEQIHLLVGARTLCQRTVPW